MTLYVVTHAQGPVVCIFEKEDHAKAYVARCQPQEGDLRISTWATVELLDQGFNDNAVHVRAVGDISKPETDAKLMRGSDWEWRA